jgi:hypothetical protein
MALRYYESDPHLRTLTGETSNISPDLGGGYNPPPCNEVVHVDRKLLEIPTNVRYGETARGNGSTHQERTKNAIS